jgi:DNA-binding PadR family transcriptional regulator
MPRRHPEAQDFLPLPIAEFHILVALSGGARHGYAIMTEVEERTDGAVRMGPGTLYGALKRMTARALIAEGQAPREEPSPDERRLYYRATALGRDVLQAEVQRMETCVAMARRSRLVGRPGVA